MNFTGERYLPSEAGDIRHEHMHRYAWCLSVVAGKDVLDVASGEGYGSAMLAGRARSVKGVDISQSAIRHARKIYGNVPGVEFLKGDAAKIPLADACVDVVVSFETIEHHDKHIEMISEIRRVLRPGGLLIMSSPNRKVYSEQAGYHNEFHVKELDFAELDELLKQQFKDVVYFGQRLAVGSSIFTLQRDPRNRTIDALTDTGSEIEPRASSLEDPIYFIAVAGNLDRSVLASLRPSVLYSEAEDLYTHHREVAVWAKKVSGDLTALSEKYAKAVADGQEVSVWAQGLQRDLATYEVELGTTRMEVVASKQFVDKLAEEFAENVSRLTREKEQAVQSALQSQQSADEVSRHSERIVRTAEDSRQRSEASLQEHAKATHDLREELATALKATDQAIREVEAGRRQTEAVAKEKAAAEQATAEYSRATETLLQEHTKAVHDLREELAAALKARDLAIRESEASRTQVEDVAKEKAAAEHAAAKYSRAADVASQEAVQVRKAMEKSQRMMEVAMEERDREVQAAADAQKICEVALKEMSAVMQAMAQSHRGMESDLRKRMDDLQERMDEATIRVVVAEQEQQATLRLFEAADTAHTQEYERTQRHVDELGQALINVRGDVASRDSRIQTLQMRLQEMDLIKASRSWRWTRPMRAVTGALHGTRLNPGRRGPSGEQCSVDGPASDAEASQRSLPVPAHTGPRPAAEVLLAAAEAGKPDFFVWAVIDWHFRIQRPQHLARELAATGHRVFYISNNFVDQAQPGFSVEPLDESGRLFQVHLHLQGSPAIYHSVPDERAAAQLRQSLGEVLQWKREHRNVSLVQHPFWTEIARVLPNHRLTYDCMDHHGGFADNGDGVLQRERELMQAADILVVTSQWLYKEFSHYNRTCVMIRNACQYEHFSTCPERVYKDRQGRKIIGYYGAIAEWFDLDLLRKVAQRHPDCLVLLVGADTAGAQQQVHDVPNVEFTGEVKYGELPFYLYGFDVCILPFKVIPLTLATNPVKVYEYLSAGKNVVSIDLPEMEQFGDLVNVGRDHDTFLRTVGDALATAPARSLVARRKQFASEQTWSHRICDLDDAIRALPVPRVSVIVVTYNNLDMTKACLQSLERYSDYDNFEIIVVDNASADDTPGFLREWQVGGADRKIILNDDNRGFAAANNQGLKEADGDYLVMLNNDTYVTPGWIATLVGHLRRDDSLGLIGPVTNNIGNEARIEINYADMDEMREAALRYTTSHSGHTIPLRTAAFFCVMLRRVVYEKVGLLDEEFGIGFFEDDDFCRRVEQDGWTIACAEDVFIHHHLSASFNKLKQETRQALFERNKAIYEKKWGSWVPHVYRDAEKTRRD